MTTHTDVAHFTAPETNPITINGLIVGYARSTSQRTDTTARQRENLEAYSIATFGRGLDAFCKDHPTSSAQMDRRPGLTALEQLARGKCSVIVVEDMDRISRKMPLVADFVMFCDELDIELHTLSGGRYLLAPWNHLSLDQIKRLKAEGKASQLQALFNGQEQPALRELLSKDQYELIKGRAKSSAPPAG